MISLLDFIQMMWRIDTVLRFTAPTVSVPAGSTYTEAACITWTADQDYLLWGYSVWMGHPAEAHPTEGDVALNFPFGPLPGVSWHWHGAAEDQSRRITFLTAPILITKNMTMNVWRQIVNGTTTTLTMGDVEVILYLKKWPP